MTENELTAAVVKYAKACGWEPHRNQVGLFYTVDGRPVRIGIIGDPDWLLLRPDRAPVFVELKTAAGRLSKVQKERIAYLEYKGFTVLSVRSVEDLEGVL